MWIWTDSPDGADSDVAYVSHVDIPPGGANAYREKVDVTGVPQG